MLPSRSTLRFVRQLLRRPRLFPALLRAAWRFRARDWYRRPPFLPLPPEDYLAWRFETAYGPAEAGPTPAEIERYLRWSERMTRPPEDG